MIKREACRVWRGVGRVCVVWGGCVQCGSVVTRYVGRMCDEEGGM